jgi:hypothetical protein
VFCVFFSISVVYLFCCVQFLSAVHVRLFAAAGRNIYCMSASLLYARLFVAVLEVDKRLAGVYDCREGVIGLDRR